jgi:hypothetical protein
MFRLFPGQLSGNQSAYANVMFNIQCSTLNVQSGEPVVN